MTEPRIYPDSNLMNMARLNPRVAVEYADAILLELAGLVAGCTVGDLTTKPENVYAQVHALKNAVAPTGDRSLIAACTEMLVEVAHLRRRAEIANAFHLVATVTTDLVTHYRRDLERTASSITDSLPRSSGL